MREIVVLTTFILLSTVSLQAASASRAKACLDIQGIPEGRLLLFGEMHGSVESPAMIAQVACTLSKKEDVAVGLEMPSKDQPLIDSYLTSRGTKADRKLLLSSDFWKYGIDGRSSSAMLKLIETIRLLKKDRRVISIFAFDDQPGTKLERNVAIANGIRRFYTSHPQTTVVALMGNVHAAQGESILGKDKPKPTGTLLEDLNPISILITYPTGTIWACMSTCGIQHLTPKKPAILVYGFKEGSPLSNYSHSYLLNSVTASPPAVPQQK